MSAVGAMITAAGVVAAAVITRDGALYARVLS